MGMFVNEQTKMVEMKVAYWFHNPLFLSAVCAIILTMNINN